MSLGGRRMHTIYFGKMNLVSEHIYSVYKDKALLRQILSDVLACFKDGIRYIEESNYFDEEGNQYTHEIEYSIYIREKTDMN